MFALHAVLFPQQTLGLRVFEERYLRMMADVLPEGPFAVAGIRVGMEVGGPSDPYRVGVRVRPEKHERNHDGTYGLIVRAVERVRLVRPVAEDPYPRWEVASFPDEATADPGLIAAAGAAAAGFLAVAGFSGEVQVPSDPVEASYALAGLVPGQLPIRQGLLEIPDARGRLERVTRIFRTETGLVRALRPDPGR